MQIMIKILRVQTEDLSSVQLRFSGYHPGCMRKIQKTTSYSSGLQHDVGKCGLFGFVDFGALFDDNKALVKLLATVFPRLSRENST